MLRRKPKLSKLNTNTLTLEKVICDTPLIKKGTQKFYPCGIPYKGEPGQPNYCSKERACRCVYFLVWKIRERELYKEPGEV
jgi:hypothetical protein